jgi:hypothetical protein
VRERGGDGDGTGVGERLGESDGVVLGERAGERDGESVGVIDRGDGERVSMREGEADGSPVGEAVGRLVRVDVGIGVRLAVGAGVSRLVCAVGFGICEAWSGTDVWTNVGVPPSPSFPLSTIGVAPTDACAVKAVKSLSFPTFLAERRTGGEERGSPTT